MRARMTRAETAILLLAVGCTAHTSVHGNGPPSPPPLRSTGTSAAADVVLQPEDIKRIVQRETPAVESCYQHNVNASRPEDRIKVTWVIGASGRPSDVRIEETTIQAPGFHTCLVATIMSWKFPASTEAVEVSFPFIFRVSE
jgi:hypothetical protein